MKRFIKLISVVFSALILLSLLVACDNPTNSVESNSEKTESDGSFTYQILTSSMYPMFKAGDTIMLERVDDASSLKVGDIITYRTVWEDSTEVFIGRIVEIYEENGKLMFITKCDNNDVNNPSPVSEDDVEGIYRQ